MRALGWLFTLMLNLAIAVVAVFFVFEPEPSAHSRAIAGAATLIFLIIVALLLLARFARLPFWASNAMRLACLSIPIALFLGSFDLGVISGQELIAITAASLFAWGTWRAFSLYSPKA